MTYIGCDREDYRFLGIISSNYLEDEIVYFKEKVEEEIDGDINFLYIYDGSNKKQDLEYLLNKSKSKNETRTIRYRKSFFDIEYLVGDKGIDKEQFLLDLEDRMKESRGTEENLVYMTIDKIWRAKDKAEIVDFYRRLRLLGNKYKHRFLIRYILKEMDVNYVYSMMLDHEHFIIRSKAGLKLYDAEDLITRSVTGFIHYNELEDKHEEEIMNTEHLKSMGKLTEGIVHDTNNILTTILGCLELINYEKMDKENIDYLNTIYKSALEGSGLMGLVLDSMRGIDRYEKDLFPLNDIVRFCIDMSYIKLKNLGSIKEIKTDVKLNSKASVYVNEYDVRQGILNIIFNAIDAMPEGGNLLLETYDEEDRAVLVIRDTGIGMTRETRKNIFEPYYTTKDKLGTGIGLSVTKRIFDSHDIVMEIDSELGEGTEFRLLFPTI